MGQDFKNSKQPREKVNTHSDFPGPGDGSRHTKKIFIALTEDARTRTKAGGTAPCLLLRTVKTETHFFEHAAAASSVALSAFAASRAPCPPHAPAAHRRRSRRHPAHASLRCSCQCRRAAGATHGPGRATLTAAGRRHPSSAIRGHDPGCVARSALKARCIHAHTQGAHAQVI